MRTKSASPQGCTNFKLRQLLRSVSRHYDAQIAKAGLKGTQYSLLSQVRSLGPISPSDLAANMGLDASTLTRNLRPLADKGWVRQGPGADARARLVQITPEGLAKHAEARVHWKQAQQSLNQLLGAEEVVAIHHMLDRTLAALHTAQQTAAADEPSST